MCVCDFLRAKDRLVLTVCRGDREMEEKGKREEREREKEGKGRRQKRRAENRTCINAVVLIYMNRVLSATSDTVAKI